jgi:hypothetical protein
MNKNLEKELKLRISMLEAKVEVLLSLALSPIAKENLDSSANDLAEQKAWQEEMHNDLLGLSS